MLRTLSPLVSWSNFGGSVASAGDVDADGLDDVIVGAPTAVSTRDQSLAYVFSNRDGTPDLLLGAPADAAAGAGSVSFVSGGDPRCIAPVHAGFPVPGAPTPIADLDGDGRAEFGIPDSGFNATFPTPPALTVRDADGNVVARFASSLWPQFGMASNCSSGDVDGDLVPDLVLALFPTRAGGQVEVFSGANGSLLHTFLGASGSTYGIGLDASADWNGDGRADIAIGSRDGGSAGGGFVEVRSGATGAVLLARAGAAAGDGFGTTVRFVGDLDRDGTPELAIGAPQENAAGAVHVVSRLRGTVTLRGIAANDGFGQGITPAGDVDGDGFLDLAIGAPGFLGNGGVLVFSGRTLQPIALSLGDPGDRYGWSVDGGRDVDGDGVPDLIVGAPDSSRNAAGAGRAVVLGGRDLRPIAEFTGDHPGDALGTGVALTGDMTRDSRSELMAFAPRGGYGEAPLGFGNGYVRVYDLRPVAGVAPFGSGCPGSAGVPRLTARAAPKSGATITVDAARLRANGAGALHFGVSDAVLGGARLPLPLDATGMTGCLLHVSLELSLPRTAGSAGAVATTFGVPPDRALQGAQVYLQYTHLDPGANGLGLVNSNALRLRIGR